MYIILLMLIFVAILALVMIASHKFKKNKSVPTQRKSVTKFKKIEEFDVQNETIQLFNNVFYSMMNEHGWKEVFTYDKLKFEKERYDDKLSVEIVIDFHHTTGLMSITDASILIGGYTKFKHYRTSTIDIEFIEFIYNKYKEIAINELRESQEKFDQSCNEINSILGKTVERGSKLNELLK